MWVTLPASAVTRLYPSIVSMRNGFGGEGGAATGCPVNTWSLPSGASVMIQAALRDASRGKGRRPPTSLIQKDGAVIGDGGSRILREHLPGNLVRGGAAGTRGIHDADHDRSEHVLVPVYSTLARSNGAP